MIYIGKARPSILESPINKDIMTFFKEYEPRKIKVSEDEEEQKRLKTTVLLGFISGEMQALIRKNENVISRDSLIIDLDNVTVTEGEMIAKLSDKLKQLNYILYPTISHGLKGVRYRLVVPLDHAVNEQEYKCLLNFFFNQTLADIIGEADQSNFTWSQMMLLPYISQYTSGNPILIYEGANVVTDKLLAHAEQAESSKRQREPSNPFRKSGSRKRNATTELFESLVVGCEEGNRNNRIAQITGGLLVRAVDVALVLELVKIANNHFIEPLKEEEVEQTFYSIARKELNAN